MKTQNTLLVEGKRVFARRKDSVIVENLLQELLVDVPRYSEVAMLEPVLRMPPGAAYKHGLPVAVFLRTGIRHL